MEIILNIILFLIGCGLGYWVRGFWDINVTFFPDDEEEEK